MAVSCSQVVNILVDDRDLINNRYKLSYLMIKPADEVNLNLKLRRESINVIQWFEELMKIWISRQKQQQTFVKNLCNILTQCEFNNTAEILTAELGLETQICLRETYRHNGTNAYDMQEIHEIRPGNVFSINDLRKSVKSQIELLDNLFAGRHTEEKIKLKTLWITVYQNITFFQKLFRILEPAVIQGVFRLLKLIVTCSTETEFKIHIQMLTYEHLFGKAANIIRKSFLETEILQKRTYINGREISEDEESSDEHTPKLITLSSKNSSLHTFIENYLKYMNECYTITDSHEQFIEWLLQTVTQIVKDKNASVNGYNNKFGTALLLCTPFSDKLLSMECKSKKSKQNHKELNEMVEKYKHDLANNSLRRSPHTS